MKKISLLLAILMVAVMALGATAVAETKLGQAMFPAHGSRAFCIATVAMDGDVITAALIEEFQFLGEGFEGVPNAENFTNEDGNVLGSKRLNDEAYSANMAANGGATQNLVTSYNAIEAFVTGKTVAELEELIDGKTAEEVVDAVSSSTLTDTLGYIETIILAAKDAA
ncbi:hypothetical protein LJC74_08970 [Eubacteriales bacterium OttesenSCG-928-A19]|nr:hypothetical protein [Eubacteriales bacterium OttesenSCG-928-A19]